MTNIVGKQFSRLGVQARQRNAADRQAKVKHLKEEMGLTGPQIAEELGIKLRTVYSDFSVIKRAGDGS